MGDTFAIGLFCLAIIALLFEVTLFYLDSRGKLSPFWKGVVDGLSWGWLRRWLIGRRK